MNIPGDAAALARARGDADEETASHELILHGLVKLLASNVLKQKYHNISTLEVLRSYPAGQQSNKHAETRHQVKILRRVELPNPTR